MATLWYSLDPTASPGALALQSAIIHNVQRFARDRDLAVKEETTGNLRLFGLVIPEEALADHLLDLRDTRLLIEGQSLTLESSLDVEVDARPGSALLRATDEQMRRVLQRIPRDHDSERRLLFESPLYLPGRHFDPRTNRPLQPHVSLNTYARVMSQLQRTNPARYGIMHKGTPFYLMGWLAYEIRDPGLQNGRAARLASRWLGPKRSMAKSCEIDTASCHRVRPGRDLAPHCRPVRGCWA